MKNVSVIKAAFIPPGQDVLLVHHVLLIIPTIQHVCRMQQQHAKVCRVRGVIQRCLLVKNAPVIRVLLGTGMDVLKVALNIEEVPYYFFLWSRRKLLLSTDLANFFNSAPSSPIWATWVIF